jgi:cell division protease FtsH
MSDFEYARDKVLMGPAREDVLNEEEKRITAYHEAGHAILAWFTPGCDRVHKVSVMPRGRTLGVTQLVPEEERYNISQHELEATLAMALGGRAAEKIQFDEYSAGAEEDLRRATQLAQRMVTRWGMSERLGPVAYHISEDHPFLGREIAQHERQFSERTAQMIDEEVAKILHDAEDRAKRTLKQHADKLTALADALLEREMLDEIEISEVVGPSVNEGKEPPRSSGVAQVASVRE